MTQGMTGRVAAPLTDSLRKATRRIDTENKIQALSDVTGQKRPASSRNMDLDTQF